MESNTLERESSMEPAATPNTFADKLRKLADWIDANEIGDGAIIHVGLEIGGAPVLVTRDHDVMRVCFPGRKSVVERMDKCDVMRLKVLRAGSFGSLRSRRKLR